MFCTYYNIKNQNTSAILFALIAVALVKYRAASTFKPPFVDEPKTQKLCISMDKALKALHKTCFLRPDTGPCRGDIIQWYFDVKMEKCFRFFWGGCQGNGNRFETQHECMSYCYQDVNFKKQIPKFCALDFDYGACFGHYYRWAFDNLGKTCKRHLYSGCGGNQNNFQTKKECMLNCVTAPNNSYVDKAATTCIPLIVESLN